MNSTKRAIIRAQNSQTPIKAGHSVFMTLIAGLVCLVVTASALAADRAELDHRFRNLTYKFEIMQASPNKRIPTEMLRKARGIILLDRTKAGFIFAYQGGGGIAMVKDPQSGQWSPPAFVSASEASLGLQIGGQQSFFVILLMNTNAARILTEPTFKFGGEASGTAGDISTGVEGSIASAEQPVLIYTDTTGLYGGAAIKGETLSPDSEANFIYYGQALMAKEILFDHKVTPTEAAAELAQKIIQFSR